LISGSKDKENFYKRIAEDDKNATYHKFPR